MRISYTYTQEYCDICFTFYITNCDTHEKKNNKKKTLMITFMQFKQNRNCHISAFEKDLIVILVLPKTLDIITRSLFIDSIVSDKSHARYILTKNHVKM